MYVQKTTWQIFQGFVETCQKKNMRKQTLHTHNNHVWYIYLNLVDFFPRHGSLG